MENRGDFDIDTCSASGTTHNLFTPPFAFVQ